MIVKHMIDADMEGPPYQIRMELVLAYRLEDCYAGLWFTDNMGCSRAITIRGDNLNTLLKIKRTSPTKGGEIVVYTVALQGHPTWTVQAVEPVRIIKMDVEVPREHAELALYTLGQINLTKEQVKKHIIQMYDDNFEALRQLKRHGVLKNENSI